MLRNCLFRCLFFLSLICEAIFSMAQQPLSVEVTPVPGRQRVIVTVEGRPFTSFIYPDTLEKPVLFPIYAPDEELVTRGFPLAPRAGEPTDHPHHAGLWMNYENVNGIDFWNNSFAIPAEKKYAYGWIRTDSVLQTKSGTQGLVSYAAHWENQKREVLLQEITTFIFTAYADKRIIDRISTLTAMQDISFPDAKDGLLGLRVAKELELPSAQPQQFSDNKGNRSTVKATGNKATGNYLTSEGVQGDSAWGKRAAWCLLYGEENGDSISIAIIDHPHNPGYPTYWHARGYGLFAANPLGQKIFSNGKQELNFSLKKNESVIFRYRIVVASGKKILDAATINRLAEEFAR